MEHRPPAAEEASVAAILDRLRQEVRRSAPEATVDGDAPPVHGAARRQAERFAFVTVDRPFLYRPGRWGRIRGLATVPLKVVLRKLMRWYVEPPLAEQRSFNSATLDLVDEVASQLTREIERVSGDVARLADDLERLTGREREARDTLEAARGELRDELTRAARRADELEGRVLRLERGLREAGRSDEPRLPDASRATSQPPAASPAPHLDYFAFEARMRGSLAEIRERQRPYVDDFRSAAPVLDVGCGRGEFLQLLGEAGVDARGVDVDDGMVAFCRGEGLDVEHADAVDYLERLDDGSLGGVFAAQVLEHLPPASIVRLLELAATKLRPGGVLVAETINPVSPAALRNYFADVTHSQPLVAETLVLIARQAGFARVDVRYLNEPPAPERLRHIELPGEPAFDRPRADLNADVDRLNEVLFAPLDYAIVART